ncbi:hypothetical protein [Motiliproteus sp.]|uniref:hypothetical protein n=1 Tax=Motiliproteus sp. TaxID=1898955 RepID=UPI003BADB5B0
MSTKLALTEHSKDNQSQHRQQQSNPTLQQKSDHKGVTGIQLQQVDNKAKSQHKRPINHQAMAGL